MPMPSSMKAISIVSSRPIWSDTQPKNGRVRPFSTRSMRQREGERRQREAEDADRDVGDLEVLGDRRELRDRHQAAGSDQHEHHVHDPEHRAAG